MKEWAKNRGKALVDFRTSAHRLALAFGLGVALGILPGTGPIAAGVVAAAFRLNLPVMVAGAFLINPLTAPLVYGGSYLLGHWLLGDWVPSGRIAQILLKTVTGNLILAVGLGFLGYLVTLRVVNVTKSRFRS
jgi:uncharacterized protein (DUF2062 family)